MWGAFCRVSFKRFIWSTESAFAPDCAIISTMGFVSPQMCNTEATRMVDRDRNAATGRCALLPYREARHIRFGCKGGHEEHPPSNDDGPNRNTRVRSRSEE